MCNIAPTPKCTGIETYNEDLSSNGFLEEFGPGHVIVKVIEGRGSNKETYGSYGEEVYHNEGDKVRLGCKLGFVNGYGKEFMGAECICDDDDICTFQKNFPEWT